MHLIDLTDTLKEYIIKGTILMDNWRSKYDFSLILDAIIYLDVSGCQWRMQPTEYSFREVCPAKKRWVMERTFVWLENFRRLCRDYKETIESANEMLTVAAGVITLRKFTSVNNHFLTTSKRTHSCKWNRSCFS